MAALTDERATKSRNLGAKRKYLCADSTQFYAGGMVMINSAGKATPAAAAAGNLGGVGVATETFLSTTAGDEWIEVQEGEFLFAADTLGQDDVNVVVYADDDQTIDETQATNAPRMGICTEYVSASAGWVRIGVGV